MPSSSMWIIIALFSIIVVLIIVTTMLGPLSRFNFFSMASESGTNLIQNQAVSTSEEYSGYELDYDGLVLPRGAGEGSISGQLTEYDKSLYCSSCSSCGPTTTGGIQTEKCGSCSQCGEIQADYFKNCMGCEGTECLYCEDTSEYSICKDIKSCIIQYHSDESYSDVNGCFIRAMTHNGESLDADVLRSTLSSCKAESIALNMGNNVERELCYFDPSSIAFYGNARPHDFYMSLPTWTLMPGIGMMAALGSGYAMPEGTYIQPFYTENGQMLGRFSVYVTISGDANKAYTVKAGYDSSLYTIGTVTTDASGFGHGIIDLSDAVEWMAYVGGDDEKNRMNAIMVDARTATAKLYYKYVTSSDAWANDLRYSKCNFETEPDPYLVNSPSWSDSFGVKSSWQTLDNPNSTIKVFYDSTSPFSSGERGRIKLQLGDLDTNLQRNCMFDIYVCSQDSFAEYEDDRILGLGEFFANLNLDNIYTAVDVGNGESIILYNTFEFSLDKEYTDDEIKSAIRTGFMQWEHDSFLYQSLNSFGWMSDSSNAGIYESVWNENPLASASYNEDCWNYNVQNIMGGSNDRILIGNCQNGICSGKIRIRVAFKYTAPTPSSPTKKMLYPTVTFCSKGSDEAPVNEAPYTGLLGGCEEVKFGGATPSNFDPFISNLCQYAWGSGRCSGTQCSCSDGTKTAISDFDVNTGGSSRGFGRVYGCVGEVSKGKERAAGSCTMAYSTDSSTIYSCGNQWGDAVCSGAGSSSSCTAKSGSELAYMFTNYGSERYFHTEIAKSTSQTAKKLTGTCQIVTEWWTTIGMPVPRKGQEYCQYAWGSASCSGNTCTCNSELASGSLSIFAGSGMDNRVGSAVLYGCVANS